jgi:hypothetical protein
LVAGDGGRIGGQYLKIDVAALPGSAGTPADLSYDRFMGPATMKSLGQVMDAVKSQEKGWPKGKGIQFTFSDRPEPAELTPATLADAVVIDSLINDWDVDQNLAVVGSLQADGSVAAVGAIPDRLDGAARANVARIVVPSKNELQVRDYLLAEGIRAFLGNQIFNVASFDEAKQVAMATSDANLKAAMDQFAAVQKTLVAGRGNVSWLRDPRVQATLQSILAKAPNHFSAQVLYDWGTSRKALMSFDGSADVIDRRASALIRAMHAKNDNLMLQVTRESVATDLAWLHYVHERLDPRTRPFADALIHFGDALGQVVASSGRPPPRVAGGARKALDAAKQQGNDEWAKMAEIRINMPPPEK